MDERSLQKIRGTEIAMIFQDVGASLDPIRIVDSQYRESILVHRKMPKEECRGLEKKMLTKMHLTDPERVLGSYPFELSGGMKQRVGIASQGLQGPSCCLQMSHFCFGCNDPGRGCKRNEKGFVSSIRQRSFL